MIGIIMNRKNSKRKGSSFEREVSKKLSKWISKGERDDLCWRTAASGGRYTRRKKQGVNTEGGIGDIYSVSFESKTITDSLAIECKHCKNLNLWSFITNTEAATYFGYWKEIRQKAKDEEKNAVLIAKENNKPTLWICDSELAERITFFFGPESKLKAEFLYENERVCVFLFDDILNLNPECFISMLENIYMLEE